MNDIKRVTNKVVSGELDSEKHYQVGLFENRILQKWLTTKEASYYLGITPNALRIWVCRGKLRAYKLGSKLRFRIDDLKHLLKQQEVYI